MTQVIMRNLAVGEYSVGMTTWFYFAPHSRREMECTQYWKDMFHPSDKGMILPGDFIFVKHIDPLDKVSVIGSTIYAMQQDGRPARLATTFGGVTATGAL